MTKLTNEIIKHDGGWAYRVDETISESFATHAAARRAAELAESSIISYEDRPLARRAVFGEGHTSMNML